ncbi:MAG: isopenicillin N synthase-like dioxygenase, partial [Candidatus Promineifilaceae bacterium]
MTNIPIIDLGPYLDGTDKMGVAQQIGRACEEIGFFTVSGHGIPIEQIQQANDSARRFFDLPEAEKRNAEASG